MTKTTRYNIIRVPRKTPYVDIPISFPPLGRLYLELMENKDKVIKDLANTEHIPKSPGPRENIIPVVSPVHKGPERYEDRGDDGHGTDRDRPSREPKTEDWADKYKKIREVYSEFKKHGGSKEDYKHEESRDYRRENDDKYGDREERDHRDREERDHREDRHRDREERDHKRRDVEDGGHSPERNDYSRDKPRDYSDASSDSDDGRHKHYSEASSDSDDDLTNRLKKLLVDSDSDDDHKRHRREHKHIHHEEYKHKYTEDRHEDRHEDRPREEPRVDNTETHSNDDKYSRPRGQAPTLAELEAGGHHRLKKEMPDLTYNECSAREEEELKREMLFKFELLKKSYKGAEVPSFTIHSDLPTMERTYESVLKSLSLDASVTDYKKYLLMSFMGIEFALGTFLKFDMEGFTQQQVLSMNSYERLLLEMGEKSYVPGGSKFPVEVRLLFLVAMNTAFFLFGKMVSKKTGFNPTSMLSRVSSSTTSSEGATRRRRPMRGPGVDPDDLPSAAPTGEVPA